MVLDTTKLTAADKWMIDDCAEQLLDLECKLGKQWLSVARIELCKGGNRHRGEPTVVRKIGSIAGPQGYIDIYARDF